MRLADGSVVTRRYSLVTDPERRAMYEIAVLRQHDGRGGSQALHETWRIGTQLRVAPPIKAMAQALLRRNMPFELHYTARIPGDMAYHDRLAAEPTSHYFPNFSRVPGHRRIDVVEVLQRAADDAVFYVCGPAALIKAVHAAANLLGIAAERVQHESFD